jgi:DHHC palmitoyltransferase
MILESFFRPSIQLMLAIAMAFMILYRYGYWTRLILIINVPRETMMVGERTPLLLRSSRSNNSSHHRQQQQKYPHPTNGGLVLLDNERGGDDVSSEDNLFLPVVGQDAGYHSLYRKEENVKADRKGWSGRRMLSFWTRQMQKGRSLLQTTIRNASLFHEDDDDDGNNHHRATTTTPFYREGEREKPPPNLYSGHDEKDERNDSARDDEPQITSSSYCNCVLGTHPEAGIWCNVQDQVGCMIAVTVWLLFGYSIFTVLLLASHHNNNHTISPWSAALYCTVAALALASHAKTALTDPGSVPVTAVPITVQQQPPPPYDPQHPSPPLQFHSMCSVCNSYKPAMAHHCRICNRCISRMDHHCPWMNNCIGVTNFKHFILFLVYTWMSCCMALILFAVNYFFCADETCQFTGLEIHLVRVMTCLCLAALLFVTSMLLTVQYSILTGVGTVDRLQKKAVGQWETATEEPMALRDIFGSAPVWTWWLPTDSIFPNAERVLGYATTTTTTTSLQHAKVVRPEVLLQRQQQQKLLPSNHPGDNNGRAGGYGNFGGGGSPRRRQWDGLEPLDMYS